MREKDPQTLPFAQRIERRALITLVHKGLKYHQIEQSHAKATVEEGTSAATLYFGAETIREASTPDHEKLQRDGPLTPQQPPAGRKVQRELNASSFQTDADPARKRGRRTQNTDAANADVMQLDQNGYDYNQREALEAVSPEGYSVADDGQTVPVEMDVDGDELAAAQDAHPIPTLTDGQSIAIQSDKVENLIPRTTILSVPDRDSIMHIKWNPRNSSILATGGDALCRLWQAAPGAASAEQIDSCDILQSNDSSLVTSMAWSPDGSLFAIATRSDPSDVVGNVSTWTDTGKALDDLTIGQEMVIKLRWNADGSLLLGITSSGDGSSSIIVWDMKISQPLPPLQCDKVITDAVWTGVSTIMICGHGTIGRWDIASDQGITWAVKDAQITDRNWSHVFNASPESVAILEEETGCMVCLDPYGTISGLQQAHADTVTAVTYAFNSMAPQSAPILASASLDGTVKYWDLATMRPRRAFNFGSDLPPLAVACNHDGSLLAAANQTKVLIWNTTGKLVPIASWKGDFSKAPKPQANGHSADRDSGIGDDWSENGMNEPSISLDWDANGKRLALGAGSQIAIMDVQP
ncbi:uncharacterized protein KY384_004337 [Bacidia gigantensis]|uniref:uncharacterized protein n=1 Tax=Bacidia gigantensis TaxID=2732470 RepID=UPI001D0521BC|nr:uncharacterized protein KY384_004337 [Bacidia gigantensis]KAG8530980.1 hypothetical protein KY384_004337 [Bacidia gigantensis]